MICQGPLICSTKTSVWSCEDEALFHSSEMTVRAVHVMLSVLASRCLVVPVRGLSTRLIQNQQQKPIMTDAMDGMPKEEEILKEMTEAQRYLFDLNGYLVVRGVLSPEEVAKANAAIDKRADQMVQRSEGALRNAKEGTKMYGQGPGRKDLGGVLEWGPEDSRVFQSILAHPKLVPLFHGILGKGYRMDHLPFVLAQDYGAEGFSLHGGTIDCTSGEYNPHLAYSCVHGTIRSS